MFLDYDSSLDDANDENYIPYYDEQTWDAEVSDQSPVEDDEDD